MKTLKLVAVGLLMATVGYGQSLPVTSGLSLWLRADTGVTTGTLNRVTGWADQSGNGLDLSQPTLNDAPEWVQNGLGKRPVLRFTSVDRLVRLSTTLSSLTSANAGDTFYVLKNTNPGTTGNPLLNFLAPDGERYWMNANASGNMVYVHGNTTAGGGRVYGPVPAGFQNTWRAMEFRRDGAAANIYLTDGLVWSNQFLYYTTFTDALDTTQSETLRLGTDSSGNYFVGDLAEVVVFNRALTLTERNQVLAYFNAQYFIPEPSVAGLLGVAGFIVWVRRQGRKQE